MKTPNTKSFNREISYVYIYVYARLRERMPLEKNVTVKLILAILKQICRVPKVLHYPILKQMEKDKLIKRINKQTYWVLKSDCIKIIKPMGYNYFWR